MSKSVLVIDTPESCAQCPLLNGSDECVMQDASANFNADSFDDLIHGCPLKPLPERMTRVAPTNHWNSIKADAEKYKLALFAVIVIRNSKVLPKGKSAAEINKMSRETMDEVLKSLDFEKVRNWYDGKIGEI